MKVRQVNWPYYVSELRINRENRKGSFILTAIFPKRGGNHSILAFMSILGVLSLLLVQQAWSDKYAGDFLTEGVGGRALGLGGAYVGVSNDVTASYWNPAGLGLIEGVQASLMHASRFPGLGSYNYVGTAHRFHNLFAVGISWLRFGVDDIPIYPELDPNIQPQDRKNVEQFRPEIDPETGDFKNIGTLSDSENAYVISLATRYTISQTWWDNMGTTGSPPDFLFGFNLKNINHSLLGNSANGFGFDAGLLVRITDSEAIIGHKGFGGISAGLNVQDISETTIKWNTKSEREGTIPTNVKWGFAYNNYIPGLNAGIVLSYEYDSRYDGQNSIGAEYQFGNAVALRLGLRDGDFAAGAGMKIDKFTVDYAFLSFELGSAHRVSILAAF